MLQIFALPLLILFTNAPGAAEVSAPEFAPSCNAGAVQQGGLLLCRGEPGTYVRMNGRAVAVFDADGRASVGLQQHADTSVSLQFSYYGQTLTENLTLATRSDDYRELTGLDCDKVDARTPEQIDHAGRSWVKKQEAFAEMNDGAGFFEGVVRPTDMPTSSPFGPTRKYTGVSLTSWQHRLVRLFSRLRAAR